MASALDWPTPVRVSAMAVASAVLMLTLSAANALAVSTSDSNNDLARMAIDFMGFLLLGCRRHAADGVDRSEEHTSELQSLLRSSYAVFCLKNKNLERQD